MIYVDFLIDYGWKLGPSCHLFSDESVDELNQFAVSIGLKTSWLQKSKGGLTHYDLTKSRRIAAIKKGAIDVQTRKELSDLFEKSKKVS